MSSGVFIQILLYGKDMSGYSMLAPPSPATPLRYNSLHLIDLQFGDLYIVLSPLLKIDYALAPCIHRLLKHEKSHTPNSVYGGGPHLVSFTGPSFWSFDSNLRRSTYAVSP